tara:strand:+ start:10040 stop:11989 length:1950 start_codon:yes stop_codon:yes gene_type:complete
LIKDWIHKLLKHPKIKPLDLSIKRGVKVFRNLIFDPLASRIDEKRLKVNAVLIKSKDQVLGIFRILSLLVAIASIGVLVNYYGNNIGVEESARTFRYIQMSFAFYVIHYLLKFIYDFHPLSFIKRQKFESLTIFILMVEGISYAVSKELIIARISEHLGVSTLSSLGIIGAQFYLIVLVFNDIFRGAKPIFQFKRRLHPATAFITTFFLLILIGAAVLLLPEMTIKGSNLSILDALFTSASATCVTGLVLHDTATLFTMKGQFVIMILIKLGGLNIIAFGVFMSFLSKMGFGIRKHEVLEDFVNRESIVTYKKSLVTILYISLVLEGLGAMFFYMYWDAGIEFADRGERIFHSVFHSLSAFNNAGFSTFTDGYYNPLLRNNYLIHAVTSVLIFLGSLGFTTLLEIFDFKRMRSRIKSPWKRLSVSSKISLYMSLILVFGGFFVIFFLENGKVFNSDSTFANLSGAFFSSVTTRTAGFNTVDFSMFSAPTIMLILLLMFIGASSSSTGGGIKTSSLFLIISSTFSTIRGRKTIEFNKKTFSNELVRKAYSVLIYSLLVVGTSTFFLCITEANLLESGQFNIIDILFEEVSAFATVGLSTGITPLLSTSGKLIIMLSMFVGRIGTLTFAYVLTKNISNLKYRYPDAHIMVG